MAKTYTDHLGNTFRSIDEMAKYYNIPQGTLRSRLEKGISIEKALTTPIKNNRKNTQIQYTNDSGKTFSSLNAIAKYYNIPRSTLKRHLEKEMSIEKALIKCTQHDTYVDCFGNTFQTLNEIANYYNEPLNIISNRWYNTHRYTTVAQKLKITPSNHQLSKFRIDDSDYYLYDFDGIKVVVTFEQIDQYHIEKYRKEHNII